MDPLDTFCLPGRHSEAWKAAQTCHRPVSGSTFETGTLNTVHYPSGAYRPNERRGAFLVVSQLP